MNSKEIIKKLTLIWIALISGQIMFAGVLLFLRKNGQIFGSEELDKILLMSVPMIVVVLIASSILIFKQQIAKIKTEENLENKLNKYQSATIISFALLESPSLLSLISFFLTENNLFLYLSILVIFLFFISKPSEHKLNMDLEISEKE